MKKTYQNPNIQVVRIATSNIMATSLPIGDSVTTAAGAESREFDYDDEEENEEY